MNQYCAVLCSKPIIVEARKGFDALPTSFNRLKCESEVKTTEE